VIAGHLRLADLQLAVACECAIRGSGASHHPRESRDHCAPTFWDLWPLVGRDLVV
jgi:hypothetical protein